MTMLASFFAGVDEWIKVRENNCVCDESGLLANDLVKKWSGFDVFSGVLLSYPKILNADYVWSRKLKAFPFIFAFLRGGWGTKSKPERL